MPRQSSDLYLTGLLIVGVEKGVLQTHGKANLGEELGHLAETQTAIGLWPALCRRSWPASQTNED